MFYIMGQSKCFTSWASRNVLHHGPVAVVELAEPGACVWEIESLVPGRVKPITYKFDTCHFLVWCSALIIYGKDWLAQDQDDVTEWDIGS